MPKYNGQTIENLTPLEAEIRGYMTSGEADVCQQWIEAEIETRHSNTIVYVNGVYKGVATKTTPLFKIIEKFRLV